MGFVYYNSNPNGYRIPDCVIRAITLAMNIPYYDVVKRLEINGKKYRCDLLNKKCYEKLLDYDFRLPHYVGNGKTAEQIAKDFYNKILILRMNGHLTTSIYGKIYDIFDCSQERITDFWIVN